MCNLVAKIVILLQNIICEFFLTLTIDPEIADVLTSDQWKPVRD